MANKRIDQPTGTSTVGHEWDGIEELDTPLPRWWLWTFYLTIAFSVGYVIAYPAWPMIDRATEGVLGWSSRGELAEEMSAADQARATVREQLARIPIERLPEDGPLMQQAVAGGAAAFRVNCVQCHGSGAAAALRGRVRYRPAQCPDRSRSRLQRQGREQSGGCTDLCRQLRCLPRHPRGRGPGAGRTHAQRCDLAAGQQP